MLKTLMSIANTLLADDSDDRESATVNELESQPTFFVYSKEHVEMLKKTFPVSMWKEGTTLEQLAYLAGQQSIIEFIENRLKKESIKVINHVST